MRNQLNDLQRQLGTGKKADSYAGLGLDRGLTVGLRSQLSAMTGYQQTITEVGVRLDLCQTRSPRSTRSRRAASPRSCSRTSRCNGAPDAGPAQHRQLDQLLERAQHLTGGRYLFAGRGVDQPAVETADRIMNGDGTRAGLKQIIDERRQADLGASGLGRLVVSAPATTVGLDHRGRRLAVRLQACRRVQQ